MSENKKQKNKKTKKLSKHESTIFPRNFWFPKTSVRLVKGSFHLPAFLGASRRVFANLSEPTAPRASMKLFGIRN